VFTARYGLILYIDQIMFGLLKVNLCSMTIYSSCILPHYCLISALYDHCGIVVLEQGADNGHSGTANCCSVISDLLYRCKNKYPLARHSYTMNKCNLKKEEMSTASLGLVFPKIYPINTHSRNQRVRFRALSKQNRNVI
jgi:hypothetical protein